MCGVSQATEADVSSLRGARARVSGGAPRLEYEDDGVNDGVARNNTASDAAMLGY